MSLSTRMNPNVSSSLFLVLSCSVRKVKNIGKGKSSAAAVGSLWWYLNETARLAPSLSNPPLHSPTCADLHAKGFSGRAWEQKRRMVGRKRAGGNLIWSGDNMPAAHWLTAVFSRRWPIACSEYPDISTI